MLEKRLIEVEQLAALIEDSLSACAGWTVPSPTIHIRSNENARENWYVELEGLDEAMVLAIASLQRRFNVKSSGGGAKKDRWLPTRLALI